MSIQTKIDIVKGLLIGVKEDTDVRLLVPKPYILFSEDFKEVDSRIKEVIVNQTPNGWSIEIIR